MHTLDSNRTGYYDWHRTPDVQLTVCSILLPPPPPHGAPVNSGPGPPYYRGLHDYIQTQDSR
jgi:hypothetical protein